MTKHRTTVFLESDMLSAIRKVAKDDERPMAYHYDKALRAYGPIKALLADKPAVEVKAVKPKAVAVNYSSDDYSTAVRMYELIVFVAPHTKTPNYEKWADVIRLIREVDGIPIATIKQVFKWANSDDFWKTNILSPSKLRKQFNQLQAKMVASNENNQRTSQSGRPSAVDRVRIANERARAERQAAAISGGDMGPSSGDIRLLPSEPVRGSDAGSVGDVIEGDYTSSNN